MEHAIRDMYADPLAGDTIKLKGLETSYRRRVGAWRILFDLYTKDCLVDITAIERRASTTYRKR
ncbi:MAG: hypothetical protein AAB417_02370 [Patescibacteria group bacterium]